MSTEKEQEERFVQPGWRADTVYQTFNSSSDLRDLSTDEKINLITEVLIGRPWRGEPGLVAQQQQASNERQAISEEQRKQRQRQREQDSQMTAIHQWLLLTNIAIGIEFVVIIILFLRVFGS